MSKERLEEIASKTRSMFTSNNSKPYISRNNGTVTLTYKDDSRIIIDTKRKTIKYLSRYCLYLSSI